MSQELNQIRVQIDSIDDQVHDLLMERASLVSSVAMAKKKEGLQIVQPAREARMIRRLLSRHDGMLPRATIVRIWRELVGSVALLQSGFRVVVSSDKNNCVFWDMAKGYFGHSVPMKRVTGDQNTLSVVRDEDDVFAVLPWPDIEGQDPWWSSLFNNRTDAPLSIISSLPYGKETDSETDFFHRAVVISKVKFLPSGDDVTFIGLEVDPEVSRGRIKDRAEQNGFNVLKVFSASLSHNPSVKIHLLEVQGYYERDDEAVSSLYSSLGDSCHYYDVMGGYPVVPDIFDT